MLVISKDFLGSLESFLAVLPLFVESNLPRCILISQLYSDSRLDINLDWTGKRVNR